jgi:hypothetical protein
VATSIYLHFKFFADDAIKIYIRNNKQLYPAEHIFYLTIIITLLIPFKCPHISGQNILKLYFMTCTVIELTMTNLIYYRMLGV